MTLTRPRVLLLGMMPRALLLGVGLWLVAGCEQKPAQEAHPASAAVVAPAAPVTASAAVASAEAKQEKPPEEVAAQHVLIAYRGAKNAPKSVKRSQQQAKALAEMVAARAAKGDDFTALVNEYSEDEGTKGRLGSLGKFGRGKMVGPFENAAFALQVDQTSAVVETEFGFHVIKRNQ